MRRIKSIFMLGIAGVLLTTTILFASASSGECNHGGEEPAYVTYKTVAVDCISTGTHPCYVGGKLTECAMHRYKYLNYTKCTICDENGPSYYSYGPDIHQYVH